MRYGHRFSVLAIFALVFGLWAGSAQAEETDQFTLPPQPLVDIGPMVSARVYAGLQQAIQQTNAELDELDSRSAADADRDAIAERQSGAYVQGLVEKEFGEGLPEASLEHSIHWDDFPADIQPMRYAPTWAWDTIYWLIFTPTPMSLTLLAPTINMYGHDFGTDKIGHFFQQGDGYYAIYNAKLQAGATPEQAHAAIVAQGQKEEHGYFGTVLDGVYSNGDLSANYAGWKFYMNFTHPVRIGNETLSPLLQLVKGRWEFARQVDPGDLLKPFINDNLSEAWNPCEYLYDVKLLRKHIRARCGDWIHRAGLTKEIVDAKLKETSLWEGEDYGHWLSGPGGITMDVCFPGE